MLDQRYTNPDEIKQDIKRVRQTINRWLEAETRPHGPYRAKLLNVLQIEDQVLDRLVDASFDAKNETQAQWAIRLGRAVVDYLVSVKGDVQRSHLEALVKCARRLVPRMIILVPGPNRVNK